MICGIDEAGRGPLAGPVTAAAVILPDDFDLSILRDSKKLSEKKRELVRREIYSKCRLWHIGWASSAEIDEYNILQATFMAMERAYDGLYKKLEEFCKEENIELQKPDIIIDGNNLPRFDSAKYNSIVTKVKADDTVHEVMAASILAKTARDKMMIRYSWLYPEYDYEKHKGYGTKAHREAIKKYGNSPIQRMCFKLKEKGHKK